MEHSGVNAVDLAVFITILLSGLLALFRGLVREVLALGAWAGAALATVYLYPVLRPWMHHHVKNEFTADALTGLTLFCAALVILIPAGYFLSNMVRGRALTAIDRSLGFVFGLARGGLIVCLLFLLTLWVWPEKQKEPDVLAQARTRPLMADGADVLKTFLPKDSMRKVSDAARAVEDKADAVPLDRPPTPVAVTTTSGGSLKASETAPDNSQPDVIRELLGSGSSSSQAKPSDNTAQGSKP